ncbi:MAG: ribosome silencing factor [Gammaproteobacteria bacterium]|jgi:ribosome-associated protein|nr:ribosome silencing factor [Gammaproteobacteria bacterium]
MQALALVDLLKDTLLDSKGRDIRVLDVQKLTDITDFMVIVSGTSSVHIRSMTDKLVEAMHKQNLRPVGIEGADPGDWVLIDCGDVVVHLMRPQTRDFYNLEKLWDSGEASDVLNV